MSRMERMADEPSVSETRHNTDYCLKDIRFHEGIDVHYNEGTAGLEHLYRKDCLNQQEGCIRCGVGMFLATDFIVVVFLRNHTVNLSGVLQCVYMIQ